MPKRSGFWPKTLVFSGIWLFALAFWAGPAPGQPAETGDVLIEASIGEASNFIPPLASDTASTAVTAQIYPGLVKYDRDLKVVPDLA
ncbi:MAG: hypothetical protein LBE01_04010, partial [Deltaproteobacteria bacterium]|nr:hypothetical protein [Deltaproteobacteria bacterium]